MDTKAFYQIGYGVYLLNCREDNRDNACIVNAVMQITSDPLTLAISVNKSNLTHDMIARTHRLNLNVLTQDVPFDVIKHFGMQSGKTTRKFAGDDLTRTENGLFRLNDYCGAWFSADVADQYDFHTHTLFKAIVTDCGVIEPHAKPLTYAFYQSDVKPKPASAPQRGWRCTVCGYVYPEEILPPDFVCPICKHGAADFEKIN